MNALFVYAAATYEIESPIEFLGARNAVEIIEPGKRTLAPGAYRFADGVGITRVSAAGGSEGESMMIAVPNKKGGWPDPPLLQKLSKVLGVTESDLVHFFGGANVQTVIK